MSEPLLVITREYPFGVGESFVADELRRLRRHGRVTVVPACRTESPPRELPDGVELDLSLADRGFWGGPGLGMVMPTLGAAASECRRFPTRLLRPKALFRLLGYLIRGVRVMGWWGARAAGCDGRGRVLCYWSNAEAFGLALRSTAGRGPVLACRAHGFDVYETRAAGRYLPFRDVIASGSERLLPVSEDAARTLRARHPSAADRVRTARLGVREPEAADSAAMRSVSERVLLSCSSDDPVKRLGLLASAVLQVARDAPAQEWRWIHLGDPPAAHLDALSPLPSNLEIETPGQVPAEEVIRTMMSRRPLVFVNMSSSEGVPVSMMEALACGIPVVATAVGGTPELVDDEVGRAVSVSVDARDAARVIRDVADRSPTLRESARRRWLERASDAMAEQALIEGLGPKFASPPSAGISGSEA